MTLAKSFPFQSAIYGALVTALPGIEIYSHAPDSPPVRHCRIDGFTMAGNDRYKNFEQGDHALTIHLIEAPEGGASSLKWVKEAIATAWGAVKNITLDGETLRLSLSASGAEIRIHNGVREAHAFIRLNVTIGE